MNIQIPIGLIAVGISLYYFYSTNRRNRLIKEGRKEARDEIKQHRQKIVDMTIALNKEKIAQSINNPESTN